MKRIRWSIFIRYHARTFSVRCPSATIETRKSSLHGLTRPGPVKNHILDEAGLSFDWRPASALEKQSVKGNSPTVPTLNELL